MFSRRALLTAAGSALLLPTAAAAYGIGIEPFWFRIKRYRVSPPDWPHDLALRIAVLADLHVCDPFMPLRQVEAIVAATNGLGADLVALVGDYVADHRYLTGHVPLAAWTRALARLEAPHGIHAVLGNHDWWEDRDVMRTRRGRPRIEKALQDAGIPVYENTARRLRKDGHPFWIGGLGDQWAFPIPRSLRRPGGPWREGTDDAARLFGGLTDDAPLVLMAHEPDIFAGLSARASLTLAGHMHAGQVRIAGFSPRLPSIYGERYRYGHIVEGGRHMIVSGGLGCSAFPVRIGAPPEIVVVDLGPQNTNSGPST